MNQLNEGSSLGACLLLGSDLPGQAWDIDPQGTETVLFLDVQDSNNINSANIYCTDGCLDSLRNFRWIFVRPEYVGPVILSPAVQAALSSVFNNAANAFSEFLVPTAYAAEESVPTGSPFADMNANELTNYFFSSPDVWTSFQTEAVAAEIVSETILYEGKVVTGLTYTNAQGSAAQQLIVLEPGQKSLVSGLAKPSSSGFGAGSYLAYVLADPKPWQLSNQLLVFATKHRRILATGSSASPPTGQWRTSGRIRRVVLAENAGIPVFPTTNVLWRWKAKLKSNVSPECTR